VADVVGVAFHKGTKTYHFDPAGLELSRGDRVVVQTMKGTEIAQVVEPPRVVDDSQLRAPLKRVVRVATDEDLQTQASGDSLRKEAMIACREMIASHGLDMKLVDADVSFGGEKITFSFYSDERVDFRSLVADLARSLKVRIELRQVGAREEARMVGGLGPCGRHLCCSLFQGDEDPVSIRMAKEQNLPLNPMKISGLCGRLMCCLKYEQDQYVRFRKEAPPKGTPVKTGDLGGAIIGYNVLKDAIVVRFEDGSISDVRLSTCECDQNGCLNCAREEEQPPPLPEIHYGGPVERAQERIEPDRVVVAEPSEAGAAPSETGGAPSEAGAEGETRTDGRPRSRRSRGRRGGRGRGPEGATAGGEQGGSIGEAGAVAKVAQPDGRGQRQRSGQRPNRPGEGSPEGAAGGQGQPGGQGVTGEAGEGGAKRPRRRRRPRRHGAGPGEGGGNGGDGGNSGGSPANS
jgi:cell fate regulator YaaT (PSP1 superfamily)